MRIRVPREWTLAQLAEAAGLHRAPALPGLLGGVFGERNERQVVVRFLATSTRAAAFPNRFCLRMQRLGKLAPLRLRGGRAGLARLAVFACARGLGTVIR